MSNVRLFGAAAAAAVCLAAGTVSAAVIDGARDGTYGAPLAVQNSQSSFGSGNSLCAAYAEFSGGNLNLMVTGNIGTGFERLVVLVDTNTGGQNVLNNVPSLGVNGMTLDAGFNASHAIVMNGDAGAFYVNFGTPAAGSPDYAGSGPNAGGTLAGGQMGAPALLVARDNAGAGVPFGFGVLNAAEVAAAAAQTTGIEFGIPMSWLGNPATPFKAMVFILGGDGAARSTQFLGGINGAFSEGDYSSAAGLDLSQIAGDQFFVIPTPGSAALLGLAGVLGLRRRRQA